MALSNRSIERLIDLAENKLSDICPFDRDDLREISELESCIAELDTMHVPKSALSGGHQADAKRAAG